METTDKNEIKTIVDDALVDLINEVHIIRDEVYTPIKQHDNPILGGGLLAVSIVLFIVLFIYKSKLRDVLKSEEKINFVFVISGFFILCLLTLALYFFGCIRLPKAGLVSEEDVFIIFISIVAIVGAIWAILARIDAGKAFDKSVKIFDKSDKILASLLGDTFPLYDIVNENKASPMLKAMGENGYNVSLFIGFPCIGFLYTEKKKLNVIPDLFFLDLIHKLDTIDTNFSSRKLENFNFCLGIFPQHTTEDILAKYQKNQKIFKTEPPSIDELKKNIDKFYVRAKALQKLNEDPYAKEKNISIKIDLEMRPDENLRFISVTKGKPGTDVTNKDFDATNKVIVWIVKNLMHDNVIFDSQCFQSSDPKLIAIIQSAFDNMISYNGLHNGTDAMP